MSHTATCPRCQAPLAADAPEGLCPACLLAGGLSSEPSAGSAATTPWTDEKRAAAIAELASHFPQLDIIELLGQGGMGAVYKAKQIHLDRLVALKVIPPEAAKEPAFAERFAREARALARLNHPNIVTVYDFGQSDGIYFLLMEYVDGLNLRQTMQAGKLSPPEALAIVPHVCDALQFAHDQGIVHRDIKPENVLLDKSGRVKIADFGLAKLLTYSPQDFTLTHSMQVMGTPRYMAPEQIEKPTEVDHRADIYSLGVMFYEMLTGELPMGRFAPPSQKVQIDIRIDEIVLRTLEKEPGRRYQQASEVKTELETVRSSPRVGSTANALPSSAPPARRAPLSGSEPPASSAPLADLPQGTLGRLLLVVGMLVFSLLIIGVGIMLAIMPPVLNAHTNDSLGYFGAAFGCIIGGAGSLLGTLNTYRQMAGRPDWMESEYRTWLDRAMLGYLLAGVATLLLGWMQSSNVSSADDRRLGTFLLVLGWIVVLQAVLFLVYRATVGRLSKRMPSSRLPQSRSAPSAGGLEKSGNRPEPESIIADALAQVSAPGMGLIISGVLGLLVPCASVFFVGGLFVLQSASMHSGPDYAFAGSGLLLAQNMPAAGRDAPVWFAVLPIVVLLVQAPVSILLILGGRNMRQLETYGLAVAAAICALLPTGPAWIISLPVGIWALVVLANPEVREGFQARRTRSRRAAGKSSASDLVDTPFPNLPAKPAVANSALARSSASQQIYWPGLGLVVGGGLGLASFLLTCLAAGVVPTMSSPPNSEAQWWMLWGVVAMIFLQIPWALAILMAGLKMMRVESYGICLGGACLALLPLGLASLVTMPLGIWALVVLSSREVKAEFSRRAMVTE